jgi:hypothetical protein
VAGSPCGYIWHRSELRNRCATLTHLTAQKLGHSTYIIGIIRFR